MVFLYEIALLVCGSIVTGPAVLVWSSSRRKALALRMRDAHLEGVTADALFKRHGVLANEVAHELKNPITAITCAADTLEFLLGDKLDEWEGKTLRHIKDNGEYVMKLMGDFIDLTKGATGQLVSAKEEVAVSDVLSSVVGILEPSAGRRSISINTLVADDSVYANVDPKHLKQILFNLIHNAIKFTPHGGTISVSSGVGPDWESVTLEVSDSGPGIPADRLDSLFDPLRPNTFRHGEAGSGLGLPLTKALVELEGGDLSVVAGQGGGATFRVIIPRAFPSISRLAGSQLSIDMHGTRPLRGQSVLIVEADPVVRETLQRVITKLGAAVDGVAEAVDALQAVNSTQYTAVVLDETIDPSCGIQIAQLVKEGRPTGEGRVFIASFKPLDEEGCKARGADGQIEKPLAPTAVLDLLMGS